MAESRSHGFVYSCYCFLPNHKVIQRTTREHAELNHIKHNQNAKRKIFTLDPPAVISTIDTVRCVEFLISLTSLSKLCSTAESVKWTDYSGKSGLSGLVILCTKEGQANKLNQEQIEKHKIHRLPSDR